MEKVWEIFSEELLTSNKKHNLLVHAFVLMSNHYHLIAGTPDANISQCMHGFMGRVSRSLCKAGNRINETFAGRHYKTILARPSHFLNVYKYNYRNPVEAGLCTRVEDYEFSTLYALSRGQKLNFPVVEDITLFPDVKGCLAWLNEAPKKEKLEAVAAALRKPYFQVKKYVKHRGLFLAEDETI